MCAHLNIFPKGTLTAKRPGFKCEHLKQRYSSLGSLPHVGSPEVQKKVA